MLVAHVEVTKCVWTCSKFLLPQGRVFYSTHFNFFSHTLDIWWLCTVLSVFYVFIQLSDTHFAFLVKLLFKISHLSLSENTNICKKVLLCLVDHISFRRKWETFWNSICVWFVILLERLEFIFRAHRVLKGNHSLSSSKNNVVVEFWSLIAILLLCGLVINML